MISHDGVYYEVAHGTENPKVYPMVYTMVQPLNS